MIAEYNLEEEKLADMARINREDGENNTRDRPKSECT